MWKNKSPFDGSRSNDNKVPGKVERIPMAPPPPPPPSKKIVAIPTEAS